MKDTVKLGKYLFITCAIAGVALAFTNFYTSKKIEQQKSSAKNRSLSEVLPAATDFKVIESSDNAFEGFNGKKRSVGYVLAVSTDGYSSWIQAMVGVDKKFTVTGLKILSQQETPGLGSKIAENGFLEQFKGKIFSSIKLKKDGGTIDGITSATISSRAITDAVRDRINEFKANKK